jgi:hypothetical protein
VPARRRRAKRPRYSTRRHRAGQLRYRDSSGSANRRCHSAETLRCCQRQRSNRRCGPGGQHRRTARSLALHRLDPHVSATRACSPVSRKPARAPPRVGTNARPARDPCALSGPIPRKCGQSRAGFSRAPPLQPSAAQTGTAGVPVPRASPGRRPSASRTQVRFLLGRFAQGDTCIVDAGSLAC